MDDRLILIKRREREFYVGLLDSPRLRLVVYDPRVQPGGTARDFVTLFDLLDRRAKHIRADEVGQNLRAASDLPSDELNAAVDEYCHVAGIDPDAEWADARRRDAGLRGDVCRYSALRRQKRELTYESLLHTFEWLERRDDILKRDENRCVTCRSSRGDSGDCAILEVHHRYYVLAWLPWDYPDEALVTLCMSCHRHLHGTQQVPVYQAFGGSLVCRPAKIEYPRPRFDERWTRPSIRRSSSWPD